MVGDYLCRAPSIRFRSGTLAAWHARMCDTLVCCWALWPRPRPQCYSCQASQQASKLCCRCTCIQHHGTAPHSAPRSLPLTSRWQQVPHGINELRLEDLPLLVALLEVRVRELYVEGLYTAGVVGQHGGQADGGVGKHIMHAAGAAQHLGPLVAALHQLRRRAGGQGGRHNVCVGGGGGGGRRVVQDSYCCYDMCRIATAAMTCAG